MKKILGLDLGPNSVGWALVNEAENEHESSSIIKLGVRANLLTADEQKNFKEGKSITTNADRTLKEGMRRNLQRYKLRRGALIDILKDRRFITDESILAESGNKSTFETYRLRAKAVTEKITLEELARVLLMINKKRGYKSNRKIKNGDEGTLIDGMEVAKKLYEEGLTPGQLCVRLMEEGKRKMPDFYRSDLMAELDSVWEKQKEYYPELLTDELKEEIQAKNGGQTKAILTKYFVWTESVSAWSNENACMEPRLIEHNLEGIKWTTNGLEQKLENYRWREKALSGKIEREELAIVLRDINAQLSASSGYLGAISDRSKQLVFSHRTVGQFLMDSLSENPNGSLRNMVFYRQDYLDEFNAIWEKQAQYHEELTPELKEEIRDVIIFYQRKLKSKKGLVGYCELERRQMEIERNGRKQVKTIGCKVIPRSHPLFQEFRIWQTLNDIKVFVGDKSRKVKKSHSVSVFEEGNDSVWIDGSRLLTLEEMQLLAEELSVKKSLTKADVLRLLFGGATGLDMNFKQIDGNQTNFALYSAYSQMLELYGYEPIDFKKPAVSIKEQVRILFNELGWNEDILSIDLSKSNKELDSAPGFQLWHLLYSYEGDDSMSGNDKLVRKLMGLCHLEQEYAAILANVSFLDDYGNLSAKAIHRILPKLKEGYQYDAACLEVGYRHSKSSLTKEEIGSKVLKDRLELLPKNSLRNPAVEKILNQMVNVVNAVIDTYGKPDEIRVELARELKKSAQEREELEKAIRKNTKAHEAIRAELQKEFGMTHVSRNDIIRYKLWKELAGNGYKALYSGKEIEKDKLFGKEIDTEHIIPQSRLFNDSYSNKTLEFKSVNVEKGNRTAYDFVKEQYGEEALEQYKRRCEALFKKEQPAKLKNLLTEGKDIPDGFINRDLRETQYISKKALSMLGDISRRVVATTGSITDRLRKDWQLVDLMKELNLPKYEAIGAVETFRDKDGRLIRHIGGWTKRNDHRHHAMDALTVAFTKDVFVQYFNHMNASNFPQSKEHAGIVGIKHRYFDNGRAIPPIPLTRLRAEAKKYLEEVLISIKAKNKVITLNVNRIKTKHGEVERLQQTPRGQLHKETIYGSRFRYVTKEEKVNASFDAMKIGRVCKPAYRTALLKRLEESGNNAKAAFTGKNSLVKNPVFTSGKKVEQVPEKVKMVSLERMYTIRKPVDSDLNVADVVDVKIRSILQRRLDEFGGDKKEAFANLEENPIWLNKEKGIQIKKVVCSGISTAIALHSAKDYTGRNIVREDGTMQPVDFVNTGNNHHVAIYRHPAYDKSGSLKFDESGQPCYEFEEVVVSFFEAVTRANLKQPIVDKEYKRSEGWEFLFTMKQNEYFVFPNASTGFNPKEIDLLNPENYAEISPNLFRVQKFSTKYYVFRHHLETTVEDTKELQGIAWKRITSLKQIDEMVKVRVNHIGQIVAVGEY